MCCINSVKYLLAMKTEKSIASSDGTGLYQHRLGDCGTFLNSLQSNPALEFPGCLGHVLYGTGDIKGFKEATNKQTCSYLSTSVSSAHISRFSYYRSCYLIFETTKLKDQLDIGAESTGLGVIYLSLFLPALISGYLGCLFELVLPSLERERMPALGGSWGM